jgi:hypothetical protein
VTRQLDLFIDSRVVVLANEAVRAIRERDAAGAIRHVAAIRAEAPDYPGLPSLETLARFLTHWPPVTADASSMVPVVRMLEDVIAPAASEALGDWANDMLAPFFRDLAEASRGLPYDPSHASVHRARLSLRCGDWTEAEEAALAIPHASNVPDALHWLAVARYRQHGLSVTRSTLFALAWCNPGRLASLIAELRDEALERDFMAFNRVSEWSGIAASDLPAWFPAWYVLEHPAAAADVDDGKRSTAAPARAARLVARILEVERQGDWKRLVALREELNSVSEDLFSLYMVRRSVRYLK